MRPYNIHSMPQAVTGRGFSNTYKNHMNRFFNPYNLDLSLNFLDIPQISNLKERWDFYFCKTLLFISRCQIPGVCRC